MPAVRPILGRICKRLNKRLSIIPATIQRHRDAREERKSASFNMYSSNASSDFNTRSFTANDPYCRTVDVEGIGLDGFGYTVTITAGGPGNEKRSRLRKLVFPEDFQSADPEKAPAARPKSVLRSVSRASTRGPWASRRSSEKEKGIEIVTRQSLEVVTEQVLPRESIERVMLPPEPVYRPAQPAPAPAGPTNFFYETDESDDHF